MRRLAFFATVALLAGCQLSTDFDRSRIGEVDAGDGRDADGRDAGDPGDDAGVDAGPMDAGMMIGDDAGPGDAGTGDAGPGDAGPGDAGSMDGGPPDAGMPDAGAPDAGMPDAGMADAGPPDAGCTMASECDDSNMCTMDTCTMGACVNAMISCDDMNPCTTNTCVPATGCMTVNNTDPCDDSMACTTPDTCSGGACVGGPRAVALAPTDDGSGASGGTAIPDLVISEIRPGMYIELYNTTGAAILLSGASHQLCRPFDYVPLATHAPTVSVPALGYATVPWPGAFSLATAASGEIILYSMSPFSVDTNILDYVCWGSVTPQRQTQAVAISKWSGGCAPAITGGSLHRIASRPGDSAADYDVTSVPSPADACVP